MCQGGALHTTVLRVEWRQEMKWIPADPAHENSGAHKRRGSRGIMGHGIDLKGSLP